jgi:hypothetical protein
MKCPTLRIGLPPGYAVPSVAASERCVYHSQLRTAIGDFEA